MRSEQLQVEGSTQVEILHHQAHGLPLRLLQQPCSTASSICCFCRWGARLSGG